MVNSIIFTLIGLSLMCVACWWMGYKTCESRSKHEYDKGWLDAEKALKEDYVYVNRDEMLDNIYREEKGRQLLNEMEELFEEDKEGVDCGFY